jgi:transglutaminase-like putative cysteine protease
LTAVWRRLLTAPAPVGAGGGFGLAPFLLAHVGAAVGVSLAGRLPRRRAPWAAAAPAAVLVASLVLGADRPAAGLAAGLAVGLALGLGALVWAAWRAQTWQPGRAVAAAAALALGAAAGLGAGGLAEQRPRLVVRDQISPPFDPRDYPSPLSAYRRYLKADLKSKVLLRVSGLPDGATVKLAVMDRFDGVVWNVSGGGQGEASGNFGRLAEVPVDGQAQSVDLENHDAETVWLYSVGSPLAVEFADDQGRQLREALRLSPSTGALALPLARTGDVTYTIATAWQDYRPPDSAIAAAESGAVALPDCAQVQAADLAAAAATVGAATAGAQALALERFLRTGYYSDGQEGPGEGSALGQVLAGHGADRLTALLGGEAMVGDAEQYASAMAVMARSLGLPARVVMGFAPGRGGDGGPAEGSADGSHTFTGIDMSAWVEVNLDGLGWVGFFPTPDRQDTPSQAQEQPRPRPRPQVAQPPPVEARPSAPPDEDLEPAPVGSARPAVPPAVPAELGALAVSALVAGGLVAALAAAALVVACAKARRRRHRARDGPPAQRIAAGWQQVVGRLRDLRLAPVPPPSATRLDTARRAPGAARDLLVALAGQADAAAFGASTPSDADARHHWRRVELAERVLGEGLSHWRRLRARLAPGTLVKRGCPARRRGETGGADSGTIGG